MKKTLIGLLTMLTVMPSVAQTSETLLLTGKVTSAQKQIVTAPRGSRWQIQIQWMEEEGKIVEQGQPILLFDGTNEQDNLEQNKERLETQALELKQLEMQLSQAVTEAEGRYRVAKMEVEKARIEASVPASELSQYDKGLYDLALQRSLMEMIKAEEGLALAKQELVTGLQKKRIEILTIEEEIAFLQQQLARMRVTAELSGPITYAMHPWSGEKLAAGMNVQASWNVLDVQASEGFQIDSWVHETDADRLSEGQSVSLTLDAYPDRNFVGKVSLVSSQAEKKQEWSRSVYFPITIEFDEAPNVDLMPGMSVRIKTTARGQSS